MSMQGTPVILSSTKEPLDSQPVQSMNTSSWFTSSWLDFDKTKK
jgi:hypothetical protein